MLELMHRQNNTTQHVQYRSLKPRAQQYTTPVLNFTKNI